MENMKELMEEIKKLDNFYDLLILEKRSEKYKRLETIQKFVKTHALGKCNCKKNNKLCNYDYNPLYPIYNLVKEAYLISEEKGNNFVEKNIIFFETSYNLSQSITQSLKCVAGRDWEDSFLEVLKEAGLKINIDFSCQVNINNEGIFLEKKQKGKNTGHKIDFVIPPPKFGSHIKNHKGFIISNKTTTRERVHQDKFVGKFVLITTENFPTNDPNIRVITPKKNENQLTLFISDVKKLLMKC